MSKVKAAFLITVLLFISSLPSGCQSTNAFARNRLEQSRDALHRKILIYNGMEYRSAEHYIFSDGVDTAGYTIIGYAKLNIFPYMPVYAKNIENPDFVVFDSGYIVYFRSDKFPNLLATEYSWATLIESADCPGIRYDQTLILSEHISPEPVTDASENVDSRMYTYVAELCCYLREPQNTYSMIPIYENSGVYFLYLGGINSDVPDCDKYYPIIEGSDLHLLVLELLSSKEIA